MRLLGLVMIISLVSCEYNKISYSRKEDIVVHFGLLKDGETVALKKTKESYPFQKEKVLLGDRYARCEYDISSFNDMIKNGGPLLTGLELIIGEDRFLGVGEIVPGYGNGVVQLGKMGSYQCVLGLKEIF